jgi:hypothetical protein
MILACNMADRVRIKIMKRASLKGKTLQAVVDSWCTIQAINYTDSDNSDF